MQVLEEIKVSEYLHLILMFYDSLSHYRGSGCKGKGGGVRTCFIG